MGSVWQDPPQQTSPAAQLTHTAPPAPQNWLVLPGTQGPSPLKSQQPLGHFTASQMHSPWSVHRWPLSSQMPQLPPQPFGPQVRSVQTGVHSQKAEPPGGLMQLHDSGQTSHANPPNPQASAVFPGSQLLPMQQPLMGGPQLVFVQIQAVPSALHCWPMAHGPQLPLHPSEPQTLPAQLGRQHTPPASRLQMQLGTSGQSPVSPQKPVQAIGAQAPPAHSSCAVHWAHASPPVPQAPSLFPGWQLPSDAQQPFGQFAAPHAQRPLV